MITTTYRRAGLLALALMAGTHAPGVAQTRLEAEGSMFVGATWFLAEPPDRFAIHSAEGVQATIVQGGSFDDALTIGVNTGVRIDDQFGVELMFAWVPTKLTAASGLGDQGGAVDANSYMYAASALFHIHIDHPIEPFVGIGVGGESMSYDVEGWERDTELMGNVLGGANIALRPGLALRVEARDCITWFRSELAGVGDAAANDLMLTAGLSLRTALFGG